MTGHEVDYIRAGDAMSATYLLDSADLVWLVVRDGGMATRATYEGVVSIGVHQLDFEAGPLVVFTPADVRAAVCPPVSGRVACREALQAKAATT